MTHERTTDPGKDYADRVLREAMLGATAGLDPEQAHRVAANILEGLEKQSEALKAAEYAPGDYEKIARSMAHAMKSADGLVRLMEFASGRPDSRTDAGTDWLRGLTNEQLTIVSSWVEANAVASKADAPGDAPAPRGGCR
jgi:hypothetical protein